MQQKTQDLHSQFKVHCAIPAGFLRHLNVTADGCNPQMKSCESCLGVQQGYLAAQAALNYSFCPWYQVGKQKNRDHEQNEITCFMQPHTIHHPQGGCEGQQSLKHQRILLP